MKKILKVLLFNGSPNEFGCTYTALKEISDTLKEEGVESQIFHVGKSPITSCMACGACTKLGKCVVDDKVNEILARSDEFDGLVIGSPVYYAGPSGQIRAFLDRLFYAGGRRFAGKPGAAVVSCRRGGATAAFDQLNKYFTISSMPIVSSQYWNQVHGSYAEQVFQDEEGLQTMRTLGNNMAWLLKCIQLGKENGITLPEREPPVWTNFVR